MATVEGSQSHEFRIGSDPELFLKRNGVYVSAIDKFEGTKDTPIPAKALGRGYYTQVDNVMVEYNTPAVNRVSKWLESHDKAISYIKTLAAAKDCEVCIDASAELPDSELEHPLARVFGCSPDFNAWTLSVNPSPYSSNPNLRSAGGHIHVGLVGLSDTEKVNLIRCMDILLGAWSVIDDPDLRRKELYGRPGAMRFKPYGVEYRTVSNFWLKSPDFINKAYILTRSAVALFRQGTPDVGDKVLRMHRHNDQAIARDLLDQFALGML